MAPPNGPVRGATRRSARREFVSDAETGSAPGAPLVVCCALDTGRVWDDPSDLRGEILPSERLVLHALEVARAEGPEMVIVGSRARGVMGRFGIGSVSDHVVRHAPCPVLVVRSDAPLAEAPLAEDSIA